MRPARAVIGPVRGGVGVGRLGSAGGGGARRGEGGLSGRERRGEPESGVRRCIRAGCWIKLRKVGRGFLFGAWLAGVGLGLGLGCLNWGKGTPAYALLLL